MLSRAHVLHSNLRNISEKARLSAENLIFWRSTYRLGVDVWFVWILTWKTTNTCNFYLKLEQGPWVLRLKETTELAVKKMNPKPGLFSTALIISFSVGVATGILLTVMMFFWVLSHLAKFRFHQMNSSSLWRVIPTILYSGQCCRTWAPRTPTVHLTVIAMWWARQQPAWLHRRQRNFTVSGQPMTNPWPSTNASGCLFSDMTLFSQVVRLCIAVN